MLTTPTSAPILSIWRDNATAIQAELDYAKSAYAEGKYLVAYGSFLYVSRQTLCPEAEYFLADLLSGDYDGVPHDIQRACDLYHKVVDSTLAFYGENTVPAHDYLTDSLYQLGRMYEQGMFDQNDQTIIPQDIETALLCYERASQFGHIETKARLGSLYLEGKRVTQDTPKASELLKQVTVLDNDDSAIMLYFGDIYCNGLHGVEKNLEEALKWYVKGYELGHKDATEKISDLLDELDALLNTEDFKMVVKENGEAILESTFESYRHGLKLGLLLSQQKIDPDNLARCYYLLGEAYCSEEQAGSKNINTALTYFLKAADLNYHDAVAQVGLMYATGGDGVEPNPQKAFEWYVKAHREHRNPRVLNRMSIMLDNQLNCLQKKDATSKSRENAYSVLLLAANAKDCLSTQHYHQVIDNLGFAYANRVGVEKIQ